MPTNLKLTYLHHAQFSSFLGNQEKLSNKREIEIRSAIKIIGLSFYPFREILIFFLFVFVPFIFSFFLRSHFSFNFFLLLFHLFHCLLFLFSSLFSYFSIIPLVESAITPFFTSFGHSSVLLLEFFKFTPTTHKSLQL